MPLPEVGTHQDTVLDTLASGHMVTGAVPPRAASGSVLPPSPWCHVFSEGPEELGAEVPVS